MRWASTLSLRPGAADAFAEAAAAVEKQLEGSPPHLLALFASPHHAGEAQALSALSQRRFRGALLVGCTGSGVIGGAREVEEGPAISLTAASLPQVGLRGFRLEMTSLPGPEDGLAPWRELCGPDPRAILLLTDPFTMDAHALVAGLDRAFPSAPKFGGLASGGGGPAANRLLVGGEVARSGAVGVAFSGDIAVDTLVAQGCRPVGKPMLVTRCRGSVLEALDEGPPLQVIQTLYEALPDRDRELMEHSLFLGLDMRQERVEYDPGELLVRNIVGADRETGAIGVGAELRSLQAVQFVLRDPHAAEEDLQRHLRRRRASPQGRPTGALLFSCVGRGEGLFGTPDHDSELFEEQLGPAPLGGFFCNGEIGPVGGTTYLHGYTSSFALFRERRGPRAG